METKSARFLPKSGVRFLDMVFSDRYAPADSLRWFDKSQQAQIRLDTVSPLLLFHIWNRSLGKYEVIAQYLLVASYDPL